MTFAASLLLAASQPTTPRLATGNLSVDAIQHSPIGAQPDPSYQPDIPTVDALKALREQDLWAYEDYIAWGMVEPVEGQWDWSHHEEVYHRVTQAGLVYIPYIWCHFPPTWLRDDPRATLMKETVEGKECYILSIYDPRTIEWYRHFYRALNEQFGNRLQEVYACLLGPYGEGNYPLPNVDWVVELKDCPDGRYWCADRFALPHFREAMIEKYGRIDALNKAWGAHYADFDSMAFPIELGTSQAPDFTDASPHDRRRWLDFIHWYHQALMDFSAQSIDTVVEIFGKERVATKPGGNAGHMNPVSWGTYNPGFAKLAGRRGIAMQSADSHGAYWADKWTSTAYAFYGVPYRTEAAGGLDENAFIARTFTDISCGASRLFTYQIEKHLPAAMNYLHLFTGERGKTDVALLAPTTIYYLNGDVMPSIEAGMALRDRFDYDVLDELLVNDGALPPYRVLIAIGCNVIEENTIEKIKAWVEQGGVLLWTDAADVRTISDESIDWLATATPEGAALGQGFVYTCEASSKTLSLAADPLVFEKTTARHPRPLPRLDATSDSVWLTEREHELLLFNNGSDPVRKSVNWNHITHEVTIEPHAIQVIRKDAAREQD